MTKEALTVQGDLLPGGHVWIEVPDESEEHRARSILLGRARGRGMHLRTRKTAPRVIVGHSITNLPGDGRFKTLSDNGVDSVMVSFAPGDKLAAQRARGRWRYRLEQRLAPGAYVLTREVRPGLLEINGYNVPA